MDLSKSALSRATGEARCSVIARIKRHGLEPSGGNRKAPTYDLRAYLAAWKSDQRPDVSARERVETARAEKLEREVARIDGELVPVSLLESALSNFAVEVRREVEQAEGMSDAAKRSVLERLSSIDPARVVPS